MRKRIEIPKNCPECSSELVLTNGQLFCKNTTCPAVSGKKVMHFIKTLNIKGLGEKSVEKLHIHSIEDIFSLTKEEATDRLQSEKLATKIMEEIDSAKEYSEAHKVLAAFGIPLVGINTASKLSPFISSIEDITQEVCKRAGLGNKATEGLLDFMQHQWKEYSKLPINFSNTNYKNIDAKGVVCITGKLHSVKNKAEAKTLLEGEGYTVEDNLTKKTDFLLDEENKQSSKRKKAEEYGTSIINNINNLINRKNI